MSKNDIWFVPEILKLFSMPGSFSDALYCAFSIRLIYAKWSTIKIRATNLQISFPQDFHL